MFGGQNLCESCLSGLCMTNSKNRRHIYCQSFGAHMMESVIECSGYQNKAKPELYQLERIAWVLQTDKNRGPLGFAPPSQRDKESPVA